MYLNFQILARPKTSHSKIWRIATEILGEGPVYLQWEHKIEFDNCMTVCIDRGQSQTYLFYLKPRFDLSLKYSDVDTLSTVAGPPSG